MARLRRSGAASLARLPRRFIDTPQIGHSSMEMSRRRAPCKKPRWFPAGDRAV